MKIFITGATGFLGYHIANQCISKGFELLCLRRSSSKSLFDSKQEAKITWVNSDEEGWENIIANSHPDVLIHCAWGGVSIESRNNQFIQDQNVKLAEKIFKLYDYKQIVVLGSQEEYGRIDSIVDESFTLNPLTEYAKAKVKTCKLLEKYAIEKKIEWQWIRVFTVYGEKQSQTWLIPTLIRKCLESGESVLETTKGEQKYSYLYSSDFANAIVAVIGSNGKSGIYNVSSSVPTKLNDLFEMIKHKTKSNIVFSPVLPYRENQSMMIMGDSTKFREAFGNFEETTLSKGLDNIIQSVI